MEVGRWKLEVGGEAIFGAECAAHRIPVVQGEVTFPLEPSMPTPPDSRPQISRRAAIGRLGAISSASLLACGHSATTADPAAALARLTLSAGALTPEEEQSGDRAQNMTAGAIIGGAVPAVTSAGSGCNEGSSPSSGGCCVRRKTSIRRLRAMRKIQVEGEACAAS